MRQKLFCFIALIGVFFLSCDETPTYPERFLDRLDRLPGVEVTEKVPYYGFPRAFQIEFTQPVDHDNPGGPTFRQRAYLYHVDESAPMIFAPSGYSARPQTLQEMAGYMTANHLSVSHRYFDDARPNPLDWQYLTVRQAAEDHHRIVSLLKTIYTGVWISSGASKSGQAALFHRRFYPDDVRATIAYVAPIFFSDQDMRIDEYIKTIGSEACRNELVNFQRRCLENCDSLLPYFQDYYESNGSSTYLTMGEIFEYTVFDYPWSFWGVDNGSCTSMPGTEASFSEISANLATIGGIDFYTKEIHDYYAPWGYQALTETGNTGYDVSQLSDLIVDVPNPTGDYIKPQGVQCTYNPNTLIDIAGWLQTEGNNIIYIYGGQDPFTGAAIELTGQTNALKIIQPGGTHRVRIADLDNPQTVIDSLEAWLGITLGNAAQKAVYPPDAFEEIIPLRR